jgi:hypothetical protein
LAQAAAGGTTASSGSSVVPVRRGETRVMPVVAHPNRLEPPVVAGRVSAVGPRRQPRSANPFGGVPPQVAPRRESARSPRRRLLFVALAAVVVLAVALLFIVPLLAGNRGGPPGGGSSAGMANPPAAANPSPGTETGSTQPSGSATAGPSYGVDVDLPSGWHLHEDDGGFSVPIPEDWSVLRRGDEVYFRENGGQGRLLIVSPSWPDGDPAEEWRRQESVRRSEYRDYERLRIEPVDYWDEAADWEFRTTSDRGNRLRVLKRGFVTDEHAYSLSWYTSDSTWEDNRDELDLILRGFEPA